ncbi:DBP [bottlenose dolphin adenovirus 2]|uniref:DNA-binding protein n=1 Tax=bottlenose dolphin adenovirus 2 TaxID=2849592 RepID=A0A0M3T9M9_9ADEN|nr:DBP [Bottlenose dolphin adenovirus 1]ALE15306.1 DBP [Bottlenose dolphin adenovirus 1]
MSQHYEPVSVSDISSGDEEKLIIDVEAKPKRLKKRRMIIDSDENSSEALMENSQDFLPPSKHKKTDTTPRKPPRKSKTTSVEPTELLGKNKVWRNTLNTDELKWQQAMDLAVKLLVAQRVDIKDLTLLPDSPTLECFKRCAQSWLTEKKVFFQLSFSTHKTMIVMVGRFLLDFVLKSAGLKTPNWNPSGVVVWKHGCEESLKCLHGLTMINKEQIIEMDVGSENAQRALKENPSGTKVVPNRWGRNVVQIKNSNAMACVCDASTAPNNFTNLSCGMFYTDGDKALEAFKQVMAFVQASYPKMQTARSHILFPINCDCNWGNCQIPLLGRQTCKITPFSVNSAHGIDKSQVDDPKILATLNHPSMLVFQCYNPVFRNSKANANKNCDFKISSVDLVAALQLAKRIWMDIIQTPAPVLLPEFKWESKYQVQNTILPTGQEDNDDSLF